MTNRYYIAYGSNLHIGQMRVRCPGARIIGTSEIEDYRLLFKGSKTGSYLTIEPEKGACVPVAVWEVTPTDEQELDHYEGYPDLYYKRDLTLPIKEIESGNVYRCTAFVYIMHEKRSFGIPSRDYMETCSEGYRAFGFDIDTLMEAYYFSQEKAKLENNL